MTPHTARTTGSVTLRALTLLESFRPGRTTLTLSELAADAGLPLSTAHRLVGDLVEWGALEREGGRYQVGARLRQVAANAPRGTLQRELCLPHLEDLAELTGYSALLAILEGSTLIYIGQAHGSRAEFRPRVAQPPTLTAAAGRVLAAFAPPHRQGDILAQPVPRLTPYTETEPARLREALARVRREGHSVAERQADVEHTVIATPVRGPFDDVVAAIALIVPFRSPDQDSLVTLCMAAARAAGRSLAPRFDERSRARGAG